MTRLLYNAGALLCLDECLVEMEILSDGIRLSFEDQSVFISNADRDLSLNEVSEFMYRSIIPIPSFNSCLARNVSDMHGI